MTGTMPPETAPAPKRVSPVKRLMALPPVFSLQDVRFMFGIEPGAERYALHSWKSAGYVDPVGPKLGLYYNLIHDRRGREAHLGTAIRQVFGSAILIGPVVLHDRGWTNQIPHVLTIAVPSARSHPKIDGVAVCDRPPEWYSAVFAAVRGEERGRFGLPALPPEYAVADMLKHADSHFGLRPDDIEIPEEEVRVEVLEAAFTALEVPPDLYTPVLQASSVQTTMSFR